MVVVANSTPLIALSKIGLFDLLREYFGEVIITGEVYAEVVTRGGNLFGAREVSTSEWIKIIDPDNRMYHNWGSMDHSKLFKIFAEPLFEAYGVKTRYELSEHGCLIKVFKK